MSSMIRTEDIVLQADGDVDVRPDRAWDAYVFSERCPTKETPNEDAAAIIRFDYETAVFVVADGCGGMRGGEQASNLAIRTLSDTIEQYLGPPDRLRIAILDGIEQANRAIQELRIGAACTIALVEFHRGVVRPYHVGDSMIVVTGVRGKVRYQSICHSPVGFAVESGILCSQEAMHHEDRHVVSNVLGDPKMRIEIGPTIPLSKLDTVLIGTDGLFDNVHIDEAIECLRKGKLNRSFRNLTTLAQRRMTGIEDQPCKPDDLSAIAFRQAR